MFFYEFVVVILAMILGARFGGVFFGMCGGLGLLALILLFGLAPASPPINVMLIMMSVVLAASTLQSSGGMAFLVRVAERLLRACPKAITFFVLPSSPLSLPSWPAPATCSNRSFRLFPKWPARPAFVPNVRSRFP